MRGGVSAPLTFGPPKRLTGEFAARRVLKGTSVALLLHQTIAVVAPGEDAERLIRVVSIDPYDDLGSGGSAVVEPDLHLDPGSRVLARIGQGACGSQELQQGLAVLRVLRALREDFLQLLRRHAGQSG